MSKGEKMRFKEMARLKGGKVPENPDDVTYVQFFNVVEAQKVFDKAKIKEKLKDTRLLIDFADSCSYLYHAVLRAIQASNEDTISEIADVTTQIKILVYKGLQQHVQAIYEQAIAFASETEDFEDMIKLMRLWKVSLKYRQSESQTSEAFQALEALEIEVWDKIINLRDWERLYDLLVSTRGATKEKRDELLQSIANHPLIVNDGPCLSIKAQIRRLLINDRPLENLSPMQPERIPKLIEIATLIEQHPQLFEDTLIVDRYLNVVSSYGLLGVIFRNQPVIHLAIQNLENFEQYRKATDVLVFERIEEIKIQNLRDSLEYAEADETINRILDGLAIFGERVNRKRRIHFVMAIVEIYLFTERPSLAAKLLAPLVNQIPLLDSPRPNIMLWVYYLIAEYELGQIDIMQIWATNALKYMSEHKIADEAGIAILRFLKKLASKNDPMERMAIFLLFAEEVAPLLIQPNNHYYTNRFPFEMWVGCKRLGSKFPTLENPKRA